MTNVQLYEFQRLNRRYDCLKILYIFIDKIQMISIGLAIFSIIYMPLLDNKKVWIIVSWISLIVAFSFPYIMRYISRLSSKCEREIKKAKIMDSMTTEWKQVKFSRTNFMDSCIRRNNVSTVYIRKRNNQYVDVRCYLKHHEKRKDNIQYPILLDNAMDVFDLSDFLG